MLQLIELWETFLLQLDTEEDGQAPMYKSQPAAAEQHDSSTADAGHDQEDTEGELATATDVALEQDA